MSNTTEVTSRYGRKITPPKYLLEHFIVGELNLKQLKDTNLKSVTKCQNKKKAKSATILRKTEKLSKRRQESSSILDESSSQEIEINEKKTGPFWEYLDGSYRPYDEEASKVVEQVYQQWLINPGDFDVRSVKSGHFAYMVDFRQMTQMNIEHENHTVRKIRRSTF